MREAQKMIRAGFDVRTEPYLHNILLCLRAHLLQAGTLLRPLMKGAFLEDTSLVLLKDVPRRGSSCPHVGLVRSSTCFHMRHM